MKILEFDHRNCDNKKIIIYGTIDMAYITTYCLNKLGLSVYCYANKKGNYVAPYSNVISLEELAEIYREDNVIILFAVRSIAHTEARNLIEAGIDEVYSVRKLWKEVDFNQSENRSSFYRDAYNDRERIFFSEDIIADPNRVYLYSLDAVVTERCSLKCKECSNLMQYYKKPQNLDMEELQNTIDGILNKIDRLCELRILGGEPFMNAEFVKLIDRYRDEPKISRISIFSNATIFPSEEILEHLRQPKVFMRMSDYGNLSRQLSTWIDWCEANGVRYDVVKMDLWQECGNLERHNYNDYQLKDIYGNCNCRNLPTIIGNKLYNCPYAANAANLGAMYREEANKDALIIDENITGADIDRFLYDREYLEGCRYCNGRNTKRSRILPYIQTSAPLPYEQLIDKQASVEMNHNVVEQNEDKLLSVVIPVYNMEKYIERCLLSVLNQTYKNLEIIVVDDGSTDSSAVICSKILKDDITGRIRFIQNDHAGVVTTRNTGIKCAAGEFITFVDADDYLDADYLEKLMAQIGDCDIICSGYTNIFNDKIIPDAVMDRGQGRKEIISGGIRAGVYEGLVYMKTLWRYMLNWSFPLKLKKFLWGNIYKTDILQRVCDGVDSHIFWCEDAVLFYLYMINCQKVKIIDEYGYCHDIRDSELRYPWEKLMFNNEAAYESCKNAFQEHPQKALLMESLGDFHLFLTQRALKQRLSQRSGGSNFYYPYFGRLKGKRVILYGAGNVGKCYYRHITEDADCVFVAWVDKNADKLRKTELLPVGGVECLQKYVYDIVILAVYDENIYKSVREELILQGVPENKIVWNATKFSWD